MRLQPIIEEKSSIWPETRALQLNKVGQETLHINISVYEKSFSADDDFYELVHDLVSILYLKN